jgi:hypothetical protein
VGREIVLNLSTENTDMQAYPCSQEVANSYPLNQGDLVCWLSENPPIQGSPEGTSKSPKERQREPLERQHRRSLEQLPAARAKLEELRQKGRLELKQVWLDEPYWRELAKHRKYRMPAYYLPLTRCGIERVLARLGLGKDFFQLHFGLVTYSEFVERNPTMPQWAFAGHCLELLDEGRSLNQDLTI